MKISRILITVFWMATFICTSAFANDDAILTLSGNISRSNQPGQKAFIFSYQDLAKIGATVVRTKTTWTKESDFSGPKIADILKAAGASPSAREIEVQTFDNYPVSIPIADFLKWEVILAYAQDGKRLTLSTKGPLWIIYPVDKYKNELDNNATRSKFAWAVKGFVVH